jgi:hypothetical protein
MKRFMPVLVLLFGFGVFIPAPLPAQDTPPEASIEETTTDAKTAKEEFIEITEGEVKVKDIVTDATEVYAAVTDLKEAKEGAKKGAILLLLVTICKFLLSGVKLAKKHFWKTRKGKTVLRLSAVGLGLAVLILGKLVAGVDWMDALFYALSGPGAIVAHELLGVFAGMKDDKDAEPAPG